MLKSSEKEDKIETKTNIEDLIDFIVSEREVNPKDQRLANVLSTPLPPMGLKEVFLSCDSLNAISSGSFKIKDLLNEVNNKAEGIRDCEMTLFQYSIEKNRLKEDINLLKSQLEAEEQLRMQAEAKSTLMHKELEKLHKINSEHNIEREDLKQRIKQMRIEIDLIDASGCDTGDSILKVQKVIAEIQADHARNKEEAQNLRETNKILTQRTAHERQKRDQLLKQRYYYKQQLSQLTPKKNLEENDLEEYDYLDTEILPSRSNILNLRSSDLIEENEIFQSPRDQIDTVSDNE